MSTRKVVVALQLGCCANTAVVRLQDLPLIGTKIRVPRGVPDVVETSHDARQLVGTERFVTQQTGTINVVVDEVHRDIPAFLVR
ncbi:MAG: hypothetical protein NT141_01365 [candidate division WWE3 bacterium]|nr:hypothetical protein [candidate division WWE3 bacterium]